MIQQLSTNYTERRPITITNRILTLAKKTPVWLIIRIADAAPGHLVQQFVVQSDFIFFVFHVSSLQKNSFLLCSHYTTAFVTKQSQMPNKMTVSRDDKGQLYYTYQKSQEELPKDNAYTVTLYPEDVLHIPGLGFDGLVGYSPIAMAKNAIGLAIATEEYGSKFFANGAQPSGVLEHPGTIKDPSRIRESWQNTFGGSGNANKVAVLEEGIHKSYEMGQAYAASSTRVLMPQNVAVFFLKRTRTMSS